MSATTHSTPSKSGNNLANTWDIKSLFLAYKKELYILYTVMDSGKLAPATIRYLFDIYFDNYELASKAIREWMASPTGIATTAFSASAFVMIALMANFYDKQDKNSTPSYAFLFWPYFREALKSLRNTYRAVLSTLTLIHLLDIEDLCELVVPVSVVLGGVVVLNRMLYRYNSSQRTKIMEANASLLAEIKSAQTLDVIQIRELTNRIMVQSSQLRIQLLISSVINGTMDGFNPYLGTLTVSCLAPQMLATITVFCAFFFLTTLTVKVYEETKLQGKLETLQQEIQSALLEKQMCYAKHRPQEPVTPALYSGVKHGLMSYKFIMITINTILFFSLVKIKSMDAIHRALLGISTLSLGLVYTYIASHQKGIRKDSEVLIQKAVHSTNQEVVAEDSNVKDNILVSKGTERFQDKNLSSCRSSFFARTNDGVDSCRPSWSSQVARISAA